MCKFCSTFWRKPGGNWRCKADREPDWVWNWCSPATEWFWRACHRCSRGRRPLPGTLWSKAASRPWRRRQWRPVAEQLSSLSAKSAPMERQRQLLIQPLPDDWRTLPMAGELVVVCRGWLFRSPIDGCLIDYRRRRRRIQLWLGHWCNELCFAWLRPLRRRFRAVPSALNSRKNPIWNDLLGSFSSESTQLVATLPAHFCDCCTNWTCRLRDSSSGLWWKFRAPAVSCWVDPPVLRRPFPWPEGSLNHRGPRRLPGLDCDSAVF